MHQALKNLPTLDTEALTARVSHWSQYRAGPGTDRTVIEWSVGLGPKCFVYPAARREAGFDLCEDGLRRSSDERWADFLEFDFVPRVAEALKAAGLQPQALCADQRPVQVQRARRREIEAKARARTGAAH